MDQTYFDRISKDLCIYLVQFYSPNDLHKLSLISRCFSILNDVNGYVYSYYWDLHIGGDLQNYATKMFLSDFKSAIIHVYQALEYTYVDSIEDQLEYCIKYQLIVRLESLLFELNRNYSKTQDQEAWIKIFSKCYYWYQGYSKNSETIRHLIILYGPEESKMIAIVRESRGYGSLGGMGFQGRRGSQGDLAHRGHPGDTGPRGSSGPPPRGHRGYRKS